MPFNVKFCLTLIPAVLASIAVVASCFGGIKCYTAQFAPVVAVGITSYDPTYRFGPWFQEMQQRVEFPPNSGYYKIQKSCTALPFDMVVDSKLKATRAFTILAPFLGGILTIALWLGPLCGGGIQPSTWMCLAIMFITIVPLFQGLTFLLLDSSLCLDSATLLGDVASVQTSYPNECQWDEGTTANVVSLVLFFVTGLAMMAVGAPPNYRAEQAAAPPEVQQVTYQKTENPYDGTSTVQEVQVIKGTAIAPPPPPTTTTLNEELPQKEQPV